MPDYIPIILLLVFIFSITFFSGYLFGQDIGYRQGQIDALTGKQYYCLQKQSDLSLAWVYRAEGCKK